MITSKIKELISMEKTICIFDVDGVLTPLEFGEYNHYYLNDEEWEKMLENTDCYETNRPIKMMQDFINMKDKSRVYVVTRVMNEKEVKQKQNFLMRHYAILPENVYSVSKNEEKLEAIKKIHKKYPDLEPKYFVMVDDTVAILNHIMENSDYSTMHISSFFN